MTTKDLNLNHLIDRIKEFDVTKIDLKENELNLSIKLRGKQNLDEIKKVIESKFSEYNVQILFFIDEEKVIEFKKIIGISSGKGGVGKSMTTLNLAFALRDLGHKVGILDADIYSPSIPGLLGVLENPQSEDGRLIEPIKTHGIELLSMGLFLKDGQCQIWQDHMIGGAFSQFLMQTNWNCEYLIIDFAGGMNAAYQECVKICPNIELIMITQANKMIYRDVLRMYALVKAMGLKVMGFVENMTDDFYPEEKLKEFEIDLKYINRLMTIPCFESYKEYIELTYPKDYKQAKNEREIFQKLIQKII